MTASANASRGLERAQRSCCSSLFLPATGVRVGLSTNIVGHGCPDTGTDRADVHAESPALQRSILSVLPVVADTQAADSVLLQREAHALAGKAQRLVVGVELFAHELLRRGLVTEAAELRAILESAMNGKPRKA